jgi:hypothetical protein
VVLKVFERTVDLAADFLASLTLVSTSWFRISKEASSG